MRSDHPPGQIVTGGDKKLMHTGLVGQNERERSGGTALEYGNDRQRRAERDNR